jgi:FAD/FMN-containing dehydrogenase
VDRILQFKIIVPTGEFLTVNEAQHPDLFWALRGGGGGTFGVVMETTFRVEPKLITLQV